MEFVYKSDTMAAWAITTANIVLAPKHGDLEEEQSTIIMHRNFHKVISHQENNRLDKAKAGRKGRRKEETCKAYNYSSRELARKKANKIFIEDPSWEEVMAQVDNDLKAERINVLEEEFFSKSDKYMETLKEYHALKLRLIDLETEMDTIADELAWLKD